MLCTALTCGKRLSASGGEPPSGHMCVPTARANWPDHEYAQN